MKKIIIAVIVILVLVVGGYLLSRTFSDTVNFPQAEEELTGTSSPADSEQANGDQTDRNDGTSALGTSVEGRDITAYHYGDGETELLFVGGIHGGYSWNTALVAYELMDYLEANLNVIPDNVEVTVVPVLNPDGLEEVVGTAGRFTRADVPTAANATIPGRFNANNVDLNRNFDCDWQAQGTWQNRTVSGGSSVFSEPESQAIRDYVTANNPRAVVVWYSAAGGVFASSCHNGVLPETTAITTAYAEASGYPAYEEFNFYEITGDMVNWLAKNNIPGISVLLSNHSDIEWEKNRAGIEALLNYYAN